MTGCCVNAAAFCAEADGCVVIVSWLAEPAVMLIEPDAAPVNPVAAKLRVRAPIAPVIDRVATSAPMTEYGPTDTFLPGCALELMTAEE